MYTVPSVFEQIASYIYYTILGCFQEFTKYMGNMGAEIFDNPYVQGIVIFFQSLAALLFLVGLLIAIFDCSISYGNEKGSIQNTTFYIFKGMLATSLFAVVPINLFKFAVSMQYAVSKVLGGALFAEEYTKATPTNFMDGFVGIFVSLANTDPVLSIAGSVGSSIGSMIMGGKPVEPHIPSVVNLLFIIAFAYAFFKVMLGNLKRGTILLIQVCTGSLYMFNIPRGFMDGFFQWCKQIIGTCLIVFLQNTILILGLQIFRKNMPVGIGLMLGAADVPNIVRMFGGSDSGIRANITGAIHATSSIMSLGRMLAPVK